MQLFSVRQFVGPANGAEEASQRVDDRCRRYELGHPRVLWWGSARRYAEPRSFGHRRHEVQACVCQHIHLHTVAKRHPHRSVSPQQRGRGIPAHSPRHTKSSLDPQCRRLSLRHYRQTPAPAGTLPLVNNLPLAGNRR